MEFFAENPLVCFGALVCLWPGIVPVAVAFWLGRKYDWRSPFVQRGDREIEV